MRNSTVLVTLAVAVIASLGAFALFFPHEAELMTGSIRRLVDHRYADFVRLEYMASNPELSRGWRTLRVVGTGDQCLPLLDLDHSRDRNVAGSIGSLRCVSYRTGGEQVQILATRRLARP